MRQAVIGLVAHVDAGKTTLAEALLHKAGIIRTQGRVDHRDSYLDFDPIERDRGITVFSKQFGLEHDGARLMFLDTPGHVDFCAEAERTMQVLDLAVLLVGANDGVTGHTKTLWRLLARYQVPTVIFVNKCDLYQGEHGDLMGQLSSRLDAPCVDMSNCADDAYQESLATCDEEALEEYLDRGQVSPHTFTRLVCDRKAFPCLFGSALRNEGVDELLDTLSDLAQEAPGLAEPAARIYQVSRGSRGERIAWLKVTGAPLSAKTQVTGTDPSGRQWTAKIDQLRIYSGQRFELAQKVPTGWVCAATGLDEALPGDGIGQDGGTEAPSLVPVLSYTVLPRQCDPHAVYEGLRMLAEEDPLLAVSWDEDLQEVQVHLMGIVQQEVIQRLMLERFGLAVGFGTESVLYKETIAQPTEGIGHFEPLRHYAEVHVRIEPLPRGAGLQFGTVCSEDELARNWQRLILTNAMERTHRGVLTGSPLTDVRITLTAGRAHAKHTEGGDFRQATYRAIRQGLMRAQSVLLEPWYRMELEVPADKVGRALADLQRMHARFEAPVTLGDEALIHAEAPVATVGSYSVEVSAYTGGRGHLSLELKGYEPCHNADQIVAQTAYEPESDLAHTPDSVFCSHGAGYTVKWNEVGGHAHAAPNPDTFRPWRAADASFFAS